MQESHEDADTLRLDRVQLLLRERRNESLTLAQFTDAIKEFSAKELQQLSEALIRLSADIVG